MSRPQKILKSVVGSATLVIVFIALFGKPEKWIENQEIENSPIETVFCFAHFQEKVSYFAETT